MNRSSGVLTSIRRIIKANNALLQEDSAQMSEEHWEIL